VGHTLAGDSALLDSSEAILESFVRELCVASVSDSEVARMWRTAEWSVVSDVARDVADEEGEALARAALESVQRSAADAADVVSGVARVVAMAAHEDAMRAAGQQALLDLDYDVDVVSILRYVYVYVSI
jgi:hypothetical protein